MIPFALPDITEREISEVSRVMRAGWITSGPEKKRFEEAMKQWIGDPSLHAIALNSATAGLHLALLGLGIGPDDEVIVPALTFVASVETVVAVGAKPVLCDVCPVYHNMRLEDIRRVATSKTKAVVVVHFAGRPVHDLEAIIRWADQWGVKVIEDAAHAIGTENFGRRVGLANTDACVFSFYATKCITTGEGGMLVTRNEELAKRVKALALHGISRDVFDRYTSKTCNWEYDVTEYGWKYNMTDTAAAMGLAQLSRERQMRETRTQIAHLYDKFLPRSVRKPKLENGHSYHLYPIQLLDRSTFIERMFNYGVGVSVHFKPIYRLSRYTDLGTPDDFPHTELYWQTCVSLPIYSKMTPENVQQVVFAVERAIA